MSCKCKTSILTPSRRKYLLRHSVVLEIYISKVKNSQILPESYIPNVR
jgi:hypothetical protein